MENGCARAHVQMQPTLTCVKLVSIGPLVTQKFERNPPSRLRDLEKGCARAHMQMHSTSDMWKARYLATVFFFFFFFLLMFAPLWCSEV